MAYDALTLHAVTSELASQLPGSRINKIYQPTPTEVLLLLHRQGQNRKLLLSIHPENARVHLTTAAGENPPAPPLFCMLLRKHCEGSIVAGVDQAGLERVWSLTVAGEDEIGERTEKRLVLEIMGKHSNLILVNRTSGLIIDSLKRVSRAMSRMREVLPGRPYLPPPPQHRADPLAAAAADYLHALEQASAAEKLWKVLLQSFEGMSPLAAREIAARAGLPPETACGGLTANDRQQVAAALGAFFTAIRNRNFHPTLVSDPESGRGLAYAPYRLEQFPAEQCRSFPTMNSLLDAFYAAAGQVDRLALTRQSLLRVVTAELARCQKKLAAQTEEWQKAEKAELLRQSGELILANLHRLHKGDSLLEAIDYRAPERPAVTVALNPQLGPSENAQHYFRLYAKAKTGQSVLQEQMAANRDEISYLEGIETDITQATDTAVLDEIRAELVEQKYLSEKTSRRPSARKSKAAPVPPRQYLSPDGFTILVGRNNKQNDWLTKSAAPGDIWLHARNIPGAHVLIRLPAGKVPPDSTLLAAAALAAYYSKARDAATVPVDYTAAAHVRKPRGAKPGLVIYDQQRTLQAAPSDLPPR